MNKIKEMKTISEIAIYLRVDINLGELIVVEMEKKKDKIEYFRENFERIW